MRLVIQRVKSARVLVDGRPVAAIGAGALVLVGVGRGDTDLDVRYLARKTSQLRIFDDEQGRLNRDISAVHGAFLVVSQFTLYGDCRKGNRPSYIEAELPEAGRQRYEQFVEELRQLGHEVQTGIFAASMLVDLQNDGPVTLILESSGRQEP